MTEQHTPGPWKVEGRTVYALTPNVGAHKTPSMVNRFSATIMKCNAGIGGAEDAEVDANVRIIAAAPLMLDTLQAVLEAIDNDDCPFCDAVSWAGEGHGGDECTAIEDAIAAARGEQVADGLGDGGHYCASFHGNSSGRRTGSPSDLV